MLKLYLRHRKDCARSYPKERRVYEPKTESERNKDRDCTISAENTLPGGEYVTDRSTGTAELERGPAGHQEWFAWDSTVPPPEIEQENPTITYVVQSFLESLGPAG
jgi:hypothetical protein